MVLLHIATITGYTPFMAKKCKDKKSKECVKGKVAIMKKSKVKGKPRKK
jgi:hypothetical protein